MGCDIGWLENIGLDTKTGLGYTGKEDKYISAVQRYYNNYEKNRAKLEEYYKAKDYENYMITVHALKSNSRMIGAADLGDMFESLEMAAKAGDTGTIEKETDHVLSSYAGLIEKLKPLGDMEYVRAAGELSAKEAKETADRLLEALDDFDDELSKELAVKLAGYPFRMTQKEKLKQAEGYIDDFLYDDAAAIIKEIYPTIE